MGWALAMLFQIHTIKLAAVDHCGRDTVSSLNNLMKIFFLNYKKKKDEHDSAHCSIIDMATYMKTSDIFRVLPK